MSTIDSDNKQLKRKRKSVVDILPALRPEGHRAEIVKTIERLGHSRSYWQVFSDLIEVAAIMLSNAVDLRQRDQREQRYMEVIRGYRREEIDLMAQAFGHIVLALESGPHDVLGRVFHDLELHNKWNGQFFSPYNLCQGIAQMTVGGPEDRDRLNDQISEKGFITVLEPACGSGAMVIALAEAMQNAGRNYQQTMHVRAIDVDLKCVHMAYIQLSLLYVPAEIIHGNTLSGEVWGVWHTNAHILDGWAYRLRQPHAIERAIELIMASEAAEAEQITEAPAPELPVVIAGPRGQLSLF